MHEHLCGTLMFPNFMQENATICIYLATSYHA